MDPQFQPPPPPPGVARATLPAPPIVPPGQGFQLAPTAPLPPPTEPLSPEEQQRQDAAQAEWLRAIAGAGTRKPGGQFDLYAPMHHPNLRPPSPGEHSFEQVATDIAGYIDHMSDQLARAMMEGGKAPFSAALDRAQQEAYYVREYGPWVFHPDGTPNEEGRDKLEKIFGPDDWVAIVETVIRARRGQMAARGAPLLSYPLYADVPATPLPGFAPNPPPPPPPPRPQALQVPPLPTNGLV